MKFPSPPGEKRPLSISTWIGIALVAVCLVVSLASGGVAAVLINGGVIALITALYVVISGRPSWLRLKGRKFGALLLGAAVIATFTGGGIAPRDPETGLVAQVNRSESTTSASPAPSGSSSPTPSVATSPSAKPKPTPTPTPTTKKPAVITKKVTETQAVDFTVTTVDDAALAAGTTEVRTPGQPGKRSLVYRVTYTDGVETARVLITDTVTVQPVAQVVANGTYVAPPAPAPFVAAPQSDCNSNYDPCVPNASDVDCEGGSGDGPAYVSGPVQVIGSDIYRLDRDGDGIACD